MNANIQQVVDFIPAILKSTHAALFLYNEKDHSVYSTPELHTLLQYDTTTDFSLSAFYALMSHEQREHIQKAVAQTSHSPFQSEIRLQTGPHGHSWFDMTWHKITGEDGTGRHLCILVSAEEKRKRKLDFQYTKLFFDKINRISKTGGWEINRFTQQRTWTSGIYDILDLTEKAQPAIEHMLTWIPDCHRGKLQQCVQDVFDHKQSFELEFQIYTYTKRLIWVRSKGEPVKDAAGEVIKARGTFQDIDEEKKQREQLQTQTHLLNAVCEMTRTGGWSLNLTTNVVFWTEETYKIHELPADKMPSLEEALSFFTPDSQVVLIDAIQQAKDYQKPYQLDLDFVTAKNNRISVRCIGKTLQDDLGKVTTLQGIIQVL